GYYRLRAHARGRDIATDGVASEPVEDYLFVVWPAPPGPETVHKQTDAWGADVRGCYALDRPRREAARATGAWDMPEDDPEPPTVLPRDSSMINEINFRTF
ncbi:MAG: hypothetical protein ACRDQW_02380, partial [Haloechinothrix sp.]